MTARQRNTWQVFILVLIGGYFFIFRGLSFELTPWTQALVNAGAKHLYNESKQAETTVLLFREKDLTDLETYFPVPWEMHAEVLGALATFSPRIVFIDFSFIDRRPGENLVALAESLCMLRDAGTKVFIAAPYPNNENYGVLPELLQCATPVSPKVGQEEGVSGVLTYPLEVALQNNAYLPTAAFAAYQAYAGILQKDVNSFKKGDMELIWPSGEAPLNKKWMDCSRPGLADSGYKLYMEGPLSMKRRCPYTTTITAKDLLGSPGDPDIETALKGRNVFYGGGFNLANDLYSSPVFDDLPGVYMHAMAFDNLITLNQAYKHSSQNWCGYLLDAILLVTTAWLLVHYPRTHTDQTGHQEDPFENFKNSARLLFVFVVLALLCLAVMAWKFEVEEILLSLASLYVLFRVGIMRDFGLGVMVAVTSATGAIVFFLMDIGPRNLLAFLVFAEVVRQLQGELKKLSGKHLDMLTARKADARGPMILVANSVYFILRVFSVDSAKGKGND